MRVKWGFRDALRSYFFIFISVGVRFFYVDSYGYLFRGREGVVEVGGVGGMRFRVRGWSRLECGMGMRLASGESRDIGVSLNLCGDGASSWWGIWLAGRGRIVGFVLGVYLRFLLKVK